jgi:hypothetical protein
LKDLSFAKITIIPYSARNYKNLFHGKSKVKLGSKFQTVHLHKKKLTGPLALLSVKGCFFHNRLGYVLAAFADHKSRCPYDTGYPPLPVVFSDCLLPSLLSGLIIIDPPKRAEAKQF